MNLSISLLAQRLQAIELFDSFRTRARLGLLLAALFSRPAGLSDFNQVFPGLEPNRKYTGIHNIPLEQVTGSVGRPADFDCSFRPLKAHLRERWVANYLHMQAGHLEPIRVYKAGSEYFVEDGHHRVSVARTTGMAFIQAEVWEYQPKLQLSPVLPSRQVPAMNTCSATAMTCSCELSSQNA